MLRLSRLPRASLRLGHSAPGHANPHFLDRAHLVDPTHPAAKLALRNLPSFVCPQFTIRAFPNAILHKPVDFVPINPLLLRPPKTTRRTEAVTAANAWTTFNEKPGNGQRVNSHAVKRHVKLVAARQLADARLAALAERGRRNVGLLFHTPKRATSKSCVVRRRLRSKLSTAFDLVVCRSADAIDSPPPNPPLKLVSRPLQDRERLVLQDWTYLVVPDLATYKTPLPNLVRAVRKALLSLSHQSRRLESSWSAPSNPPQRPRNVVTRTQTIHPLPPASEPAQSPDLSHEPTAYESVSARLYLSHPIIFSHEKQVVRK